MHASRISKTKQLDFHSDQNDECQSTKRPRISVSPPTLVALWVVTSAAYYLLTRSPMAAALLGFVSSALVLAGIEDLRTGLIPKALVWPSILAAAALDIYTFGLAGGLIMSVLMSVMWVLFAARRVSKRLVGGGDIKAIWAILLVLTAFSPIYLVLLAFAWVILLGAVFLAHRLFFANKRYRAGLAIALTAIATWTLGLLIVQPR